jgi:nucleoside phosphorylase
MVRSLSSGELILLFASLHLNHACQSRFGTCGGLSEDALPGVIVVASEGSAYLSRNVDAFLTDDDGLNMKAYSFHKVVPSDLELNKSMMKHLKKNLDETSVVSGLNITADR